MPSYYDSTKKKPGKAKVKYNKGGSTPIIGAGSTGTTLSGRRTREGKARLKDAERKPQQRRRTDPEKREAVIAATPTMFRVPGRPTGIGKRVAKHLSSTTPQERWEQSRNPITVALRKLHEVIDASDERSRNRAQNKSKGGQLKVRGMGAATSGGNFTRNG